MLDIVHLWLNIHTAAEPVYLRLTGGKEKRENVDRWARYKEPVPLEI